MIPLAKAIQASPLASAHVPAKQSTVAGLAHDLDPDLPIYYIQALASLELVVRVFVTTLLRQTPKFLFLGRSLSR